MKHPLSYKIATAFGSFIGVLIATAIVAVPYYLILVFLIKAPLNFLQIWGGVILFDTIVRYIKNS
jgi:hypothetical protein